MEAFLEEINGRRLRSYSEDPGLLKEHHGIEQTVLAGGYGYRQILELVQNGADAILEGNEQGDLPSEGNRIHVLIRDSRLYVANTGAPLSKEGLDALLRSHSSPKRHNQIGRFGLGFKSLLKLDGRIDVFTKTAGAIRFDPHRCRDELRWQFSLVDLPGLRLAWPLDANERESDRTCSELDWAETIVRVEIPAAELLDQLRQEIRSFPAEFLLFFRVPTVLVLDDGDHPERELTIEPDVDQQILHDGAEKSRWYVVRSDIRVTDVRAITDATHIHARDTVPLDWAVPLDGRREESGKFWAFFPTQTPTYVPGILNAPWKLNTDRNAIIGGEWNAALMAEAARLVAGTLPVLSSPDDPARPLDAFPRQMDRKDEVAAPLVEALWKALETAVVIPNAAGNLQTGSSLWRHPRDTIGLARRWQELADSRAGVRFIHPSCLERQRCSRLNALAERLSALNAATVMPSLRRTESASWFKNVASTDPPAAVRVIKLAESYAGDCTPAEWNFVRPNLAIIPSQNGNLLVADQLILAPDGAGIPGHELIASAVYGDTVARRICADVMKVPAADDYTWTVALSKSIENIPHHPSDSEDDGWRRFWNNLRQAPESVRKNFVSFWGGKIHVRRRDGKWVLFEQVLLPGDLVETDDILGNAAVLVDAAVHGSDGATLNALGVSTNVPKGEVVDNGGALYEWLSACRKRYEETYHNSASWQYLSPIRSIEGHFKPGMPMPRGFPFLTQLRGRPNTRLTEQYLARIAEGGFSRDIQFGHRTTPKYPKIDLPHPLHWLLMQHGFVEIGKTAIPLAAVVARRNERALLDLPAWAKWIAAFEKLQSAFPEVRPTIDDVRRLWLALIAERATPQSLADDALSDLWVSARKDGVVPNVLPSSQGAVTIAEIFVTGSSDLARWGRSAGRIVITLDDATRELWLKKGARDLSQLMCPQWVAFVGPDALLVSVVPELAEILRPEVCESARSRSVLNLILKIDGASRPVPCLLWEGTLFVDDEQLARHSRAERLRLLLNETVHAGWLTCTAEVALQRLGDTRVDELRAIVAQQPSLPERLLCAVGNRREPLIEALGALRNMDPVQRCTPHQLAQLVIAQLGPATLTTLKETLKSEGLNPPSRWNMSEARAFVASIGFPDEFALAPETKREAEESISGPIELPPLHDFQEEVMAGLRALIGSGRKRRRAVVSLPTGGGKTRVTVEAAVRLVLASPESDCRSVIWIAQTDELCEQAVQAFRQVWVNLGAQRTDLRIVRLWGGNPNPSIQDLNLPIVVVASIQTLNSRMGADGIAWLRNPGLVVVDECHHAITPSYTNLLRWLDAEAAHPGAAEKDEPPIVGLSATPFRADDEESRRLAKRFDGRWFPPEQEALHERLRAQGVLAQADYEALQSGASLLDEEIERLARFSEPWEGLDFENLLEQINQRLAGDMKRNERLIEHIQRYSERSILFFSNSVSHAEEMSARLNLAGETAAAVSGSTPAVARRYFLDRFQRGELRVLCNHSVLTTGFDAPRTDMVLIARQVFSPVRYMQMVGRGLRGEKNGGTARCRIVTVRDNLRQFQQRHPYEYCRQYFG